MTNDAQIARRPSLGLSVGNQTGRKLMVLLEPECAHADIAPDHHVRFRATPIGEPGRDPSPLVASGTAIVQKLGDVEEGPFLDIAVKEDADGNLTLVLWLDDTDEVGFGTLEGRSEPDLRQKMNAMFFGEDERFFPKPGS